MPTKEGEDWRVNVKEKAFNFPILINGNSAGGSFGAVVIPHLVKEDKFLILREWRLPLGCYVYGFPRGFPEKLEEGIDTAIREFTEEAGITVSMKNAKSIGRIIENSGISYNTTEIIYLRIEGDVKLKT